MYARTYVCRYNSRTGTYSLPTALHLALQPLLNTSAGLRNKQSDWPSVNIPLSNLLTWLLRASLSAPTYHIHTHTHTWNLSLHTSAGASHSWPEVTKREGPTRDKCAPSQHTLQELISWCNYILGWDTSSKAIFTFTASLRPPGHFYTHPHTHTPAPTQLTLNPRTPQGATNTYHLLQPRIPQCLHRWEGQARLMNIHSLTNTWQTRTHTRGHHIPSPQGHSHGGPSLCPSTTISSPPFIPPLLGHTAARVPGVWAASERNTQKRHTMSIHWVNRYGEYRQKEHVSLRQYIGELHIHHTRNNK